MAVSKLHSDIREYLACQKIGLDYSGQIERDQKEEMKRRMDDAFRQSASSLVAAYSIVAKYSVKRGLEKLQINQFKDSLDAQINSNVISRLKDEEWLLEAVGLSTLKMNNLLPATDRSIKAKDVYEAFLRFDDKPMITGTEAISKSLLKYCYNGEFAIAAGDGINFSNYFFKRDVPFFDVNDASYWLVDKSRVPVPSKEPGLVPIDSDVDRDPGPIARDPDPASAESTGSGVARKLKSITVKGRINDKLLFTQLGNYFIIPFKDNHIEIEVSFKISSTPNMQIDESRQQYKSAKEAAKQLGLDFEEDPG
jgi:hypothetical protein